MVVSWIGEAVTAGWEMPNDFSKFADFVKSSGPNSDVIIAAFSIGLDKAGKLTPANQRIVEKACELYRIGSVLHAGARLVVMFCTGANQPTTNVASATAMAQYAEQMARPVPRQDILLDIYSSDTIGNAEAVVKQVETSLLNSRQPTITLVCHPLHIRRAELCLKRALLRLRHVDQPSPPIKVFIIPAPYARDYKGVRIYAPTPGQPWLDSHSKFLFYEIMAYLVMFTRLYGLAAKVKSFLNRRHSSASS